MSKAQLRDVPIMEQKDTPEEIWGMVCAASTCVSNFGGCEKPECVLSRADLEAAVVAWYKWRKEPADDLDNYKSVPGRLVSLPSATVLRLEPGDVLVVSHPMALPLKAGENLLKSVKAEFPDHRCILLEEGAKFQVVRPSKATEAGK